MRILEDTYPTVDDLVVFLEDQGYEGSLNDMMFQYLGDQGYFGALADRMKTFVPGGGGGSGIGSMVIGSTFEVT